jgi:hypothetical protein
MDLLEGKEEVESIYKECLKSKMLNVWCKDCLNPNLIFYKVFYEAGLKEMNILRNC